MTKLRKFLMDVFIRDTVVSGLKNGVGIFQRHSGHFYWRWCSSSRGTMVFFASLFSSEQIEQKGLSRRVQHRMMMTINAKTVKK